MVSPAFLKYDLKIVRLSKYKYDLKIEFNEWSTSVQA